MGQSEEKSMTNKRRRLLLSLDMSTTNTGYALFDIPTKALVAYGEVAPNLTSLPKEFRAGLEYPRIQVYKMRSIVEQLKPLLTDEVEVIVIEEINRGKARIQQKILDGLHFVFLDNIPDEMAKKIIYRDSDGSDGWRSRAGLGLQLSDLDKEQNKLTRKFNKAVGRKDQKPVITQKHLCCKYVNKYYGTNFDVEVRAKDSDVADAIGLGHFILHVEGLK